MKKIKHGVIKLSLILIASNFVFCSNPIRKESVATFTTKTDHFEGIDTTTSNDVDTIVLDKYVCDKYVCEMWLRNELTLRGVIGDDLDRMIYIAKRESNLKPSSYNSTLNSDLSHDSGLFQINSYAWEDLWEKYDLLDPIQNIDAAVYIYKSHGFKPWYSLSERRDARKGIYNSEEWRKYADPEKL